MTDRENEHSLQNLLQALEKAEAYPHQPKKITHVQTHISHVFIVPPFVYKLKKHVDFGFLDYSTLEKRREYCHREVELNRRLCDEVYLGVSGICFNGDNYRICDEDDEGIVEYAVKMQKLEDQFFLHRIIEGERLEKAHLDRVAQKLAEFYRNQDNEGLEKWGAIDKIKVNTDENFEQTESFIGDTIDRPVFTAIRYFTNQYFVSREDLFSRRISERRIIDGHGDLHLDHIHIKPEKVRIYDCIEFNDRFRYGDLAADLAYLAMDLDFAGCWEEERYFVSQMARKLDDGDLLNIIDFYKCYRAYVKGKVKSMQSAEDEVPEDERRESAEKARRYFDLSLRYAMLGSQPKVLIVMGRVGTGKSTLAEHLAEKFNISHYSSDVIRKSLAEVPLTERPSAEKREEIYSRQMSRKTYDSLKEKMRGKIEKGESVILDATFSSVELRNNFQEELENNGIDYLFIEARASNRTITDRLEKRDHKKEVISDARIEDFDMLNERYSSPGELSQQHLLIADTDQKWSQTVEQLYISMVDRHINNVGEST